MAGQQQQMPVDRLLQRATPSKMSHKADPNASDLQSPGCLVSAERMRPVGKALAPHQVTLHRDMRSVSH